MITDIYLTSENNIGNHVMKWVGYNEIEGAEVGTC